MIAAFALVVAVSASPSPTPDVAFRAMDSCFVVKTAEELGTGFLVEGGLIVTAAHVVGEASGVVLQTGDAATATLRGTVVFVDRADDVALIEPERALSESPLPLTDAPPMVGDDAFAVGIPIGQLVASRGVVVGVSPSAIEATTPVDPGSSGGPLLDVRGNVIGLVIEQTRVSDHAVAVPSARVSAAIASLASGASSGVGVAAETASGSVPGWLVATAVLALLLAVAGLVVSLAALVTARRRPSNRIVVTLEKE